MSTKRKYIEKRLLSVPLSEGERLEFGEELARAQTARDESETSKKTTVAQLSADIKSKTAEVQRLAAIVNGKAKMAEVECHWTLNQPRRGQKVLVRQDTMHVIETRDMDGNDQQELFPDEVAGMEKKPAPAPGDNAREVKATVLGLPGIGKSTAGDKPEKKGKGKGKKKKEPGKDGPGHGQEPTGPDGVDWNAVKAFYIEKRRGILPKSAVDSTALEFKLKHNTVKSRARRDKWNEEAKKKPAAE